MTEQGKIISLAEWAERKVSPTVANGDKEERLDYSRRLSVGDPGDASGGGSQGVSRRLRGSADTGRVSRRFSRYGAPGNTQSGAAQSEAAQSKKATLTGLRQLLNSPEQQGAWMNGGDSILDAAEKALDYDQARDAGQKLLARKQLSIAELRQKLLSQEYASETVEQVVCEFLDRGYLDDNSMAELLAETLTQKHGDNPAAVRRKLMERRLDPIAVENALVAIDTADNTDVMYQVAAERAKKMGDLDYAVAKRRLLGFMSRRGWVGGEVYAAVEQALQGNELSKRGEESSEKEKRTPHFQ